MHPKKEDKPCMNVTRKSRSFKRNWLKSVNREWSSRRKQKPWNRSNLRRQRCLQKSIEGQHQYLTHLRSSPYNKKGEKLILKHWKECGKIGRTYENK